ncbi:SufD family Fe-S cluster assembly protein [uncultured Alistipes sp.]|jgi:Fe-S cluster assembly protein SufD|uniref:SufD family Fe-S cluster assembly protein n=1 Tax=uncultured Alistipes sp. TaxID=538949 RepID=UPI00259283BA|nr:SufD family Fe-S cluster assembly protein [uncultured Alistipes sp.]
MAALTDILSGFRSVGSERLRIGDDSDAVQPFVAVDSAKLRVEVAAGVSARLVVVHEKPLASSLSFLLERGAQLEVTEVFLGEALAEVRTVQAADSSCCLTAVQLAGANVSYRIDLDGAHAASRVGGLFLAAESEHCVMELRTAHNVPDCTSDSLMKGIAGGNAVGEFRGLVYVAPDAQRTDARQQSRNILLSETARIDAKPQLEIYADDVKCSHGATVGQMDAEAILYMRQRGLSLAQARRLQIEGFAGDVVRRCGIGELGEALMEAVARKMETM